jgi:hypothetical protein
MTQLILSTFCIVFDTIANKVIYILNNSVIFLNILFFRNFILHVNVLEKLSYINKILRYEIKLKH